MSFRLLPFGWPLSQQLLEHLGNRTVQRNPQSPKRTQLCNKDDPKMFWLCLPSFEKQGIRLGSRSATGIFKPNIWSRRGQDSCPVVVGTSTETPVDLEIPFDVDR